MSDWENPPSPPLSQSAARGGSIERTLAGAAELNVMDVVREAWELTYGIKGIVNGGMLLIYAAVLTVTVMLTGDVAAEASSSFAGALSELVVMVIVYPFMAGVFMLGLKRSVGQPVRFQEQFVYYARLLPVVAVGALQSALTFVGLLLLVLPGLYLMFALSLAVPLKAERDLPISDCLMTSLRLVNRKLLPVAGLMLISAALMVLGIISLIGWIWTLPWSVMILAIVYRQLAGYRGHESAGV